MRLSVAAAISHGRVYRRFGLSPRSRLDLLRNLVTALVRYERIETPWARADEMRGYAERVSGGAGPGRGAAGRRGILTHPSFLTRRLFPDPPPPSSPQLIDYAKRGDKDERAMRMADFWLTVSTPQPHIRPGPPRGRG